MSQFQQLLSSMDIDCDFDDEDTEVPPPSSLQVEQAVTNLFVALGLPESPDVVERMTRILIYSLLAGLYTPMPTDGELLIDAAPSQRTIAGPFPVSTVCMNTMLPVTGNCVITVSGAKRVVGIDKYQRLIDWVSARPCTQETLTILLCKHIHRLTQGHVQVQLELNHISFKLGESRKASQITIAEQP